MKSEVIYPETIDAIKIHDEIIRVSGGLAGTKNQGMVSSVLDHIKNNSYYPDFEAKITHLMFSIIKNHSFNDGNKRCQALHYQFFF